jgi:hypothetical protein
VGENPNDGAHLAATRGQAGDYAFIYSPLGEAFTVDLSKLVVEKLSGYWFDPRTGNASRIEAFSREGKKQFTPPTHGAGNDWVLIIDDAGKIIRRHESL